MYINAMLGGFARADEDHWNIQPVTLFENRVLIDIYLTQHSAELGQQRCDGRLGLCAKMAARPRVESHFARTRGGQARIFRMFLHGFGLEYFWNGPA